MNGEEEEGEGCDWIKLKKNHKVEAVLWEGKSRRSQEEGGESFIYLGEMWVNESDESRQTLNSPPPRFQQEDGAL